MMPHFKHKKTGSEIEVTEEFAEQVIRPQGHYEEFKPAPIKVEKVSKKSKKQSKNTK